MWDWNKRVSEGDVARILGMIADPPNVRTAPLPGDLQGSFDHRFSLR